MNVDAQAPSSEQHRKNASPAKGKTIIELSGVTKTFFRGKEPLTILDVRAKSEWDVSHIEGAVHVPVQATRARHGEIDRETTIALMCKSGARASTAGSILQQKGFTDLAVVAGGMTAWVAAGFAPECATCSLTHGPRVSH